MGHFYDMLYRRDETPPESHIVTVSAPSGLLSTPDGYGSLMSIDYSACVQTKARSMSSLPAQVLRHTSTGREQLDEHPIAQMLNGRANEEMSSASLMAWTVLRRDTFGTAYWYVEWVKGVPVAIWPVTSSVLHSFDSSAPRGHRSKYTVSPGCDYVPAGTYFSDEIVAIPTALTKDGVRGLSLARLVAEQIGLSVDLERFYRSMLKNGNHQLGHVEIDKDNIKPLERESLQRAIEAKRGVDAAGKTPIFGSGAKWVTDQQTMRDASVIEQQKWVLHQVCRACNVPPWKVYESETTTYAGGQQARIDYVADTIVPDVRTIELALAPVLVSCSPDHTQLKFKVQSLMRGEDSSRSQYYREMVYMGAMTREDVRELEDLEPLQGIDAPLFPLNYGTVETDGSVTVYKAEEAKLTEPGDGSQAGVTDIDTDTDTEE